MLFGSADGNARLLSCDFGTAVSRLVRHRTALRARSTGDLTPEELHSRDGVYLLEIRIVFFLQQF